MLAAWTAAIVATIRATEWTGSTDNRLSFPTKAPRFDNRLSNSPPRSPSDRFARDHFAPRPHRPQTHTGGSAGLFNT
jgi:hypothetical protein